MRRAAATISPVFFISAPHHGHGCLSVGMMKCAPHRTFVSSDIPSKPLGHLSELEVMEGKYQEAWEHIEDYHNLPAKRPQAIYANNELDLKHIRAFGFDYDYTLVTYNRNLDTFIYEKALELLVNTWRYPKALQNVTLDRGPYVSRGLHFDIVQGLIMKVDKFNKIQIDTVYRGHTPLSKDEVLAIYPGLHIPDYYLNNTREGAMTMYHLLDRFSIAEIQIVLNCIQYFKDRGEEYDPAIIFHDVQIYRLRHGPMAKVQQQINSRVAQSAVYQLHKTRIIHEEIMQKFDKYVKPEPLLRPFLERLKSSDRSTFLLTNSGYEFVAAGLSKVLGSDWSSLFDLTIFQAKKPLFFVDQSRPFRRYDPASGLRKLDRAHQFEAQGMYTGGNLTDFMRFSKWNAKSILYFGDHMFSDLVNAASNLGWRTAAIIPEVEREIESMNKMEWRRAVFHLIVLERLIDEYQDVQSGEARALLAEWSTRRRELRITAKNAINPYFGSIFRTFQNATAFNERLNRFADLYTSRVTNLHAYPLEHVFFPRRTPLPHEPFF